MKKLIYFSLILSYMSCSKAPSEGMTYTNDGTIIKVKIGAATTEEQLKTLSDSLSAYKIKLELNNLLYNENKEIRNIKITVDTDKKRGSTACCNNDSTSTEPITTVGFIVDNSTGASNLECLGSNCFQ
jgi:hypothetical protein